MKKLNIVLVFLFVFSMNIFAQDDMEGCKEHVLFTRLTNFYISECSENYNEISLRTSSETTETKEGNLFTTVYYFNSESNEKPKNPFQIIKNYENAVVKSGGKLMYKNTDPLGDEVEAVFHLISQNKEYWIKIGSFGGTPDYVEHYSLYVLEIESMVQEITANKILEALNKDGFIALYINFETAKFEIKPESQPIIDQIVDMLNQNKELKISIEGHTDNIGAESANQSLSENRAKAVMDEISLKGIAKSRLTSKGWGSSKPIADNGTEEGKAENRRVEIVKL